MAPKQTARALECDEALDRLRDKIHLLLKRSDWDHETHVGLGILFKQARELVEAGAGPKPPKTSSADKKKAWRRRVEKRWQGWLEERGKQPGSAAILSDRRVRVFIRAAHGATTKALERAEALRKVFTELVGLSHAAVAKALNEREFKTAMGKDWIAVQVIRTRERLGQVSRKREPALPSTSIYNASRADDRNRARAVLRLRDFKDRPELASNEPFVADLVAAIDHARHGVNAFGVTMVFKKPGVTNKASAREIFMSGIRRALEHAGLPVTRWRKDDLRKPSESLYFRLARKLAPLAGISLPKDLTQLARRAMQHQYDPRDP